jgi:hypothetical protein
VTGASQRPWSHLLEVLSLISLLSELGEGNVQKLQQDDGVYAGGGLVHDLVEVTEGWWEYNGNLAVLTWPFNRRLFYTKQFIVYGPQRWCSLHHALAHRVLLLPSTLADNKKGRK